MACEKLIRKWTSHDDWQIGVELICAEHGPLKRFHCYEWETVTNPCGLLGAVETAWVEHLAKHRELGQLESLPVHLL